ncbi:MAG TPA: hypothetical protein VGN41_16195 [Streptosporangiaceae bacterium]
MVNTAAVFGGIWSTVPPRQAAKLAGIAHRVSDAGPYAPDAPDIGSMRQFAEKHRAQPLFDATVTAAVLDFQPTPLRAGLAMTVEWLRANGEIPAATTESRASATAAGSGCGGAADAAGHALHRSRCTPGHNQFIKLDEYG